MYYQLALDIQLRSETFGSAGTVTPPRSSIMINNKEYHPNVNGHAVLAIDYRTGKIGQVNVFRTDVDVISGLQFEQYLREIPSK